MPLVTHPNFFDPQKAHFYSYTPGDDFYEALISAHAGQTEAQSHAFNARLVLVLANHIGDLHVLRQALAAAKEAAPQTADERLSDPVVGGADTEIKAERNRRGG